MIDQRASPGIPAPMAEPLGVDPRCLREGSVYETMTLGCSYCGSCVVMNPKRTRPRAHCMKCDRYICDWCDAARQKPDYVHRTIDEIFDLLRTGRWELSWEHVQPNTDSHHRAIRALFLPVLWTLATNPIDQQIDLAA